MGRQLAQHFSMSTQDSTSPGSTRDLPEGRFRTVEALLDSSGLQDLYEEDALGVTWLCLAVVQA